MPSNAASPQRASRAQPNKLLGPEAPGRRGGEGGLGSQYLSFVDHAPRTRRSGRPALPQRRSADRPPRCRATIDPNLTSEDGVDDKAAAAATQGVEPAAFPFEAPQAQPDRNAEDDGRRQGGQEKRRRDHGALGQVARMLRAPHGLMRPSTRRSGTGQSRVAATVPAERRACRAAGTCGPPRTGRLASCRPKRLPLVTGSGTDGRRRTCHGRLHIVACLTASRTKVLRPRFNGRKPCATVR